MTRNMDNKQESFAVGIDELRRIVEWYDRVDNEMDKVDLPDNITVTLSYTSIGVCVKASIETDIGEGIWKDVTDYNSW